MVVSGQLLDLPLLKAAPILQGIVEAQVVALLVNPPKSEAKVDAVRRILMSNWRKDQPTPDLLAPRLLANPGTSPVEQC
jgi:hypothetical protein